jgi:hypothetical protein
MINSDDMEELVAPDGSRFGDRLPDREKGNKEPRFRSFCNHCHGEIEVTQRGLNHTHKCPYCIMSDGISGTQVFHDSSRDSLTPRQRRNFP